MDVEMSDLAASKIISCIYRIVDKDGAAYIIAEHDIKAVGLRIGGAVQLNIAGGIGIVENTDREMDIPGIIFCS